MNRIRLGRARTTPLSISGTPATTATQGSAYGGFTVSAAGGTAPYSYSVYAGALPSGISLNASSGAVSGTPTALGTFSGIIIRATDVQGRTANLASFTITVSAPAATGYDAHVPILKDRTLYRTTLVDAGQEYIDLAREVALPYSPAATSWTLVGGADVANWEQLTTGLITVVPAQRTAVKGTTQVFTVKGTNAYGDSATVTVTVKIPADADCRFVDFVGGAEANAGTSPAAAWKYLPRTLGATNTTILASKVVFFKGGVRYKGTITDGSGTGQPSHSGTSGAPMVYYGTGWNGVAIADGADDLTGSWSSVSQAEVWGNPNYANIEKYTLSSATERWQHLFCGDTMCYLSQYPTPTNLLKFEGVAKGASGDTSEGCARVLYTTDPAVTTKPRLYRSTSGTGKVVTVVDDALNAVFNNTSYAYNALGIGYWLLVWGPGNNVSFVPVQQFDATTNTLTADAGTTSIVSQSGYTAYAVLGSPASIAKAGQFAFSPDGLTLYAWRPNTNTPSISQRKIFAAIGSGASNFVFGGFNVERFSGSGNNVGRAGTATGYGGIAFINGFSSVTTNYTLTDMHVRQMRADGGEGCFYYGLSSGGLNDSIIERIQFEECPRSSGIRCGNIFSSSTPTTTESGVRALTSAKIQYIYAKTESLGRTALLLTHSDSAHIRGLFGINLSSVHGNFISLYTDAAGTYTQNCLVEDNLCDGVQRSYTISNGGGIATSRNCWIKRNVFLGTDVGATANLYSGDLGSTWSQNLIMMATGYTYADAIYIGDGGGTSGGITVDSNVIAGFGWTSSTSSASWTVTNNLMTVNLVPPSGTNKTVSGNTTASGAPIYAWDKTLTAQMQTTLGAGEIGIFWTI